jgi:hypothetical protein
MHAYLDSQTINISFVILVAHCILKTSLAKLKRKRPLPLA